MRRTAVWIWAVVAVGMAVFTGVYMPDDNNALLICLLLILMVVLSSWERGWVVGFGAGLLSALLIAPYGEGEFSLVVPALDVKYWAMLGVCYMLAGVLVGLRGTAYRRLQRVNEELALLSTISNAISHAQDVAQVESIALAQIGNLLQPDMVHLYEYHEADGLFTLKAARPPLPDAAPRQTVTVPATHPLFAQLCKQPRVTVLKATDVALRPPTLPEEIHAALVVPLTAHERVIAVLVLGRRQADELFSSRDARFMESIAYALTVAIENAQMYQQLRELSFSDELTGLGNRRMFNLRMGMELDRVALNSASLCLVLFDLDHFKGVNDRYGHPAGDAVLKQFAQRVQEQTRATDLLCRIGGEEFTLVTPDTPLETTQLVVERIRRHVAQTPFRLPDGTEIPVTVSAGIVAYGPHAVTVDALLASADHALYQAKANGRDRAEVFSPADETAVTA